MKPGVWPTINHLLNISTSNPLKELREQAVVIINKDQSPNNTRTPRGQIIPFILTISKVTPIQAVDRQLATGRPTLLAMVIYPLTKLYPDNPRTMLMRRTKVKMRLEVSNTLAIQFFTSIDKNSKLFFRGAKISSYLYSPLSFFAHCSLARNGYPGGSSDF